MSFHNDILKQFGQGVAEIEGEGKSATLSKTSGGKSVTSLNIPEKNAELGKFFDAGVKEIEQSQAKKEPSLAPVEYGKGLVSGARHAFPEMVGQAGQALGIEKAGELTKWARKGEKPTEHGAFYQAGEMTPASLIPTLTLGAAAKGVAMLPIPGARPVAAGLQVAAWSIPAIMFGLSQFQSTREEAKKKGVEPGAAPYITGGIETAGETAGNYALTKLLGPLAPAIPIAKAGVKALLKTSLGRAAKELVLKTIPTEVVTEMGQNWGEALTEKAYGIRPEAKPTEEAVSAIWPTVIMTLVGGGAATGIQRYQANKVLKILQDPEEDIKKRQNAANVVTGVILSQEENKDKPMAKAWFDYANNQIAKGAPIDVETPADKRTKILDDIIEKYESGEQNLDQSLDLIKEGYRNQLFNDDDLDKLSKEKPDLKDKIETARVAANADIIKDRLSGAINEGLTTGVFDGHVFREVDAIKFINKGLTDNIFTVDDLEEFKESYPTLRSDLNNLIAIQTEEKIQQAFSPELAQNLGARALPPGQGFELVEPRPSEPYSPELTEKITSGKKALPPGQGFELVETRPEVKTRKAPPTYPRGAEYVAGKAASEELKVEYKPILRKTVRGDMPWKTRNGARNALESDKMKKRGISPGTHKVVETKGGYQIVPIKAEGEALARKVKEETKGNTLLSWVRTMGGVRDATLPGEVRALSGKETGVVGLTTSRSDKGLSFDEMASAAVEEGWIEKPEDFNKALRDDIFAQKEDKPRVERLADIAARTEREERWKEFDRAEGDMLKYFARHPDEEVADDLDEWQKETIADIRSRDAEHAKEIEEDTRREVEKENTELEGLKKDEGFSKYIEGWDEKEVLDEETLAEVEAWRAEKRAKSEPTKPEALKPIVTKYRKRLEELKAEKGDEAYFDESLKALYKKEPQEILDAYRKLHPKGAGVLYQGRGDMGITISPSAKEPGRWQTTWFDANGFTGDTSYKTEAEAFAEAYKDGYRLPDPERGKKQMVSPKFIEGIAKVEAQRKKLAKKPNAERVTKDPISAILSSKKKAGVKYEMEVRVAETGETATVTKDAGVALRETKEELDKYNNFLECLI